MTEESIGQGLKTSHELHGGPWLARKRRVLSFHSGSVIHACILCVYACILCVYYVFTDVALGVYSKGYKGCVHTASTGTRAQEIDEVKTGPDP